MLYKFAAGLICFLPVLSPLHAETTGELFSSICAASKDIHSAQIGFEFAVSAPPPSKEHLDNKSDYIKEFLEEQASKAKDAKLASKLAEAASDGGMAEIRERLAEGKSRDLKGIYYADGPLIGGRVYIEVVAKLDSSTDWGTPISMLGLGAEGNTFGITVDRQTSNVSYQYPRAGPLLELQTLGRIRLEGYSLANPMLTPEVSEPREGDAPNLQYLNLMLDGKLAARIGVDNQNGYICPEIDEFDPAGKRAVSIRCSDYFTTSSGVAFPSKCVVQKGQTKVICHFDKLQTVINGSVPSARFACPIPRQTSVVDNLGSEPIAYIATRDIELTLDDLRSLDSHPGLILASELSGERQLPAGGISLQRVLLLLLLAIAVFLVARIVANRKSQLSIILVASASLPFAIGCSNYSHVSSPPIEMPAAISLGRVPIEGGSKSTIEFVNLRDEPAMLKISPGCACISIDEDSIEIDAKGKVSVVAEVNEGKRPGQINSEIACSWSYPSGIAGVKRIPFGIYFYRSIYAIPSTLTLNDECTSAFIRVFGNRKQLPSIEISVGDKLQVEEVHDTTGTPTSRYFNVSLKDESARQRIERSVTVDVTLNSATLLRVPVYIR